MERAAIARAIEAVGGQTALAKILGITTQAISQWKRVPPAHVLAIETATGGRVTRHEMRPDVFGPEPQRGAA